VGTPIWASQPLDLQSNWLKPVIMTDKWQTRPLVREGAPYGRDSNFQGRINSPELDTKTDRLTGRQLQCDSDSDSDPDSDLQRTAEDVWSTTKKNLFSHCTDF
jgi:hypothetical protein